MSSRPPTVRRLVTTTFVGAALANALIFFLLIMLFGFDLEDDIFDDQVTRTADRLALADSGSLGSSGDAAGLEMRYFVGKSAMPDWLRDSPPIRSDAPRGEIFAEDLGHFHVVKRTLRDGQELYVLFDARPFIRSTPQIGAYILIAGIMALLTLFGTLFYLRRTISRLSKPVEELALRVSRSPYIAEQAVGVDKMAPLEIAQLSAALDQREARIQALLAREAAFNRDVSHELRTPLAVAAGAVEIMEEQSQSAAYSRLKTALGDMRRLIDGILWLGRDPVAGHCCNLSDAACRSIDAHRHLLPPRDVTISEKIDPSIEMPVPMDVALVLIGNLVRNAIAYSDGGEVQLTSDGHQLSVRDDGIGLGAANDRRQGFGVGLGLVERLSRHFDIELSVEPSGLGGTVAILRWRGSV